MDRRALGALLRAVADLVDPAPATTAGEPTELPPVQRTVVETARAMARAEAGHDLVGWVDQPKPAARAERRARGVKPLSWDGDEPSEEVKRLRARLFVLLKEKLGLSGEAAKLEARSRCRVESIASAGALDLERGIASLVAMTAPAPPGGYTVEAGVARGLTLATARELAQLAGDERPPALADQLKAHAPEARAAAAKAVGMAEGGTRFRDVGQARAFVMALPALPKPKLPEPETADARERADQAARLVAKLGEEARGVVDALVDAVWERPEDQDRDLALATYRAFAAKLGKAAAETAWGGDFAEGGPCPTPADLVEIVEGLSLADERALPAPPRAASS